MGLLRSTDQATARRTACQDREGKGAGAEGAFFGFQSGFDRLQQASRVPQEYSPSGPLPSAIPTTTRSSMRQRSGRRSRSSTAVLPGASNTIWPQPLLRRGLWARKVGLSKRDFSEVTGQFRRTELVPYPRPTGNLASYRSDAELPGHVVPDISRATIYEHTSEHQERDEHDRAGARGPDRS
jgi:hypothetical protein